MPSTELKNISEQYVHYNKYGQSKGGNARIHPIVKVKRKQKLIDKLKAIGEELLSWLLLILVLTVLIQLFSNLE